MAPRSRLIMLVTIGVFAGACAQAPTATSGAATTERGSSAPQSDDATVSSTASDEVGTVSPTASEDEPDVVEMGSMGLEPYGFAPESMPELAGLVAIGTVGDEFEYSIGAEEGDIAPGEPYVSLREVTFDLEQVIAGNFQPGETVVLTQMVGWNYTPDERQEVIEEGVRLRPGDETMVVLIPAPPNASRGPAPEDAGPRYRLLRHGSFVLLDGDAIVQTDREHPYTRQLEGLANRDELIAELQHVCETGCNRETFPALDPGPEEGNSTDPMEMPAITPTASESSTSSGDEQLGLAELVDQQWLTRGESRVVGDVCAGLLPWAG